MHKVLFICTANYYRSRFSEIFFNAQALQRDLDWVADSRGIVCAVDADNIGQISEHTIRGLQQRGVSVPTNHRDPLQLQEEDLQEADLIIALDEEEHREYVEQRFPEWVDRIEYWHVHDLHIAESDDALPVAEREIRKLIEKLSAKQNRSKTF